MKNIIGLIFAIVCFVACNKEGAGITDAQGGLLPTNYIIINDSAFSPKDIVVVNGNSFTFVNQTASTKGIYSVDSFVINKQGLLSNTSFFFKKDTIGTIYYFMTGKPAVRGSITLTR